jgi:hypothetical protein
MGVPGIPFALVLFLFRVRTPSSFLVSSLPLSSQVSAAMGICLFFLNSLVDLVS